MIFPYITVPNIITGHTYSLPVEVQAKAILFAISLPHLILDDNAKRLALMLLQVNEALEANDINKLL